MAMVQDIGHLVLEVGDMEEALRFYRDVLGLAVRGHADPVWTVVTTDGGSLTLFRKANPVPCVRSDGKSAFNLHVPNFTEGASAVERAGYKVHREDGHAGSVQDPWGNVLGLHDHREEPA
jgi:predicted enzyme related to lactoylglutathione lyase